MPKEREGVKRETSPEIAAIMRIVDKGKPVLVIDRKGKRIRVRCWECDNLCTAKTKRHQKIGKVCDDCIDLLIQESLDKYQKEVDAGIPRERRMVESRIDLMWHLDKRWHDKLRNALLAFPEPEPKTPLEFKRKA
jgi:hypothetical protein